MLKFLNLIFLLFVATVTASDCLIALPKDIKEKAPVILNRTSLAINYELFKPTNKVTTLLEGTRLLLSCPGTSFVSAPSTNLELRCENGRFIDSQRQPVILSSLACIQIPYSTLQLTTTKCSNNNGYIYQAGFMVKNQFYGPVFEICKNGINTFYTHNTINGAAISYAIKSNFRRSFNGDTMGLPTGVLSNLYIRHETRFEKDFGVRQTIIRRPNFLARGHLTPDADFIFGYEKMSTYYYANVAPEFQPINAGNWFRVEELGRTVADWYGDDIESYNGYKGVLQLPNTSRVLVDMTLDDTIQIKVPKYFYKVLLHKASDTAIVYVTVNNPYVTNGPAQEFCTNVCKMSGFQHTDFTKLSKGYTFCCSLNDFRRTVHSLPAEVQANNLLKAWFS